MNSLNGNHTTSPYLLYGWIFHLQLITKQYGFHSLFEMVIRSKSHVYHLVMDSLSSFFMFTSSNFACWVNYSYYVLKEFKSIQTYNLVWILLCQTPLVTTVDWFLCRYSYVWLESWFPWRGPRVISSSVWFLK